MLYVTLNLYVYCVSFFFSSRRRHTRCALVMEFRRVLFRSPGTGDIQLTLSQKIPVSGAVIVTTPQEIALLDAKKGLQMFRRVEVPVLGVVEHMSWYDCGDHRDYIFGDGGGERMVQRSEERRVGKESVSQCSCRWSPKHKKK